MFVFWSETAAMLRAKSMIVCGVVKGFKINWMRVDGTNAFKVSTQNDRR